MCAYVQKYADTCARNKNCPSAIDLPSCLFCLFVCVRFKTTAPDTTSFNIVIAAYSAAGLVTDAQQLLDDMLELSQNGQPHTAPNEVSGVYNYVYQACSRSRACTIPFIICVCIYPDVICNDLYLLDTSHVRLPRTVVPSRYTYICFHFAYLQCTLFRCYALQVTFHSVLSAYATARRSVGMTELLLQMRDVGLLLDTNTYNIALSACYR